MRSLFYICLYLPGQRFLSWYSALTNSESWPSKLLQYNFCFLNTAASKAALDEGVPQLCFRAEEATVDSATVFFNVPLGVLDTEFILYLFIIGIGKGVHKLLVVVVVNVYVVIHIDCHGIHGHRVVLQPLTVDFEFVAVLD
ncbi:hypothetical protein V6N13_110558 [Hibiscus sabdariffa]